jgi:chromosome partitioning protein
MTERHAHIIVVGNQKGGSGKSTTAMHLIVALLHAGHKVGCIDLDDPQATLSAYIANRRRFGESNRVNLPMPEHHQIQRSNRDSVAAAEADERSRLDAQLGSLTLVSDFVVIDTPGSDSFLSRYGHSLADTLVTPMNDSFVDLDLLATVDPGTHKVLRPSKYAEMVWDQKKTRALRDGSSMDWIIMRNRLASVDSRNTRAMRQVLDELSRRFGFRTTPGFGERVIFRELFLKGLTLLDLRESGTGVRLNMSHVAARQEVRALVEAIGLGLKRRAAPMTARRQTGTAPV